MGIESRKNPYSADELLGTEGIDILADLAPTDEDPLHTTAIAVAESFANAQIREAATSMLDPQREDYTTYTWLCAQIPQNLLPQIVARAEGIISRHPAGKRVKTGTFGNGPSSKMHERVLAALEKAIDEFKKP